MLATKWLIKNNLDKFFKDVTNVKLSSYLYIDDRCICFKGNYNKTVFVLRVITIKLLKRLKTSKFIGNNLYLHPLDFCLKTSDECLFKLYITNHFL